MSITRRIFLRNGALAVVGTTALPSFLTRAAFGAADPGVRPKRLVVIFQRGEMCIRDSHHAVGNRVAPARRGENVSHAAQVAFTFFSHVADKHKRQRMRNSPAREHTGNGQYRRNARAVVGDTRAIKAAAFLPDVERGRRRKYRVDMGADRHKTCLLYTSRCV